MARLCGGLLAIEYMHIYLLHDFFKVVIRDHKTIHVLGTWDLSLSSGRLSQYLTAETH